MNLTIFTLVETRRRADNDSSAFPAHNELSTCRTGFVLCDLMNMQWCEQQSEHGATKNDHI